jgi:hypothetical protein
VILLLCYHSIAYICQILRVPTSNADGGRRPALDCRKHPSAERSPSPGLSTRERGPLDGLVRAIEGQRVDRASRGEWAERGRPEGIVGCLALVLVGVPGTAPPGYFWPARAHSASAQGLQDRRNGGSEREETHHIPQGSRSTLVFQCRTPAGETAFAAAAEFRVPPEAAGRRDRPSQGPSRDRQVADSGRLRGVSIQPEK